MKMSGVRGEVRVGGRVAANLGRWSFDGTSKDWTVEATATDIDEYWIESGGPFDLHLHIGENIRRYRDVRVSGRSPLMVRGGTDA